MKPLPFVILARAVPIFLAASSAMAQTLTGSLSTHDPVIIKQGGTYYVFHTGNGVPIKTSANRLAWSSGNPSAVFSAIPSWHSRFRNSLDSWAPAVEYWDGKYWLYHSISNFGSRRSAIGLRTNTTLGSSSGWVDQGIAVCTYDNVATHPECFHAPTTNVNGTDTTAFNAIDPDVFIDDDGTPWLSWGSFGSGIQLIRLDRATGKPAAGAQVRTIAHRYVTNSPSGSGYERSIEAPVITKHGTWYYLWYSHDRCCAQASSTYRIMVTRATSVTGPYVDKAGNPAHPSYRAGGATTGAWQTANAGTLVSQGSGSFAATGHNDIFTDNDTVFLVNHGYTTAGATQLMIRPLYWDAQGWPTLVSTQGTIQAPTVSVQGASKPSSRASRPRFVRPAASHLVPWNDGLRDVRGREAGRPTP